MTENYRGDVVQKLNRASALRPSPMEQKEEEEEVCEIAVICMRGMRERSIAERSTHSRKTCNAKLDNVLNTHTHF